MKSTPVVTSSVQAGAWAVGLGAGVWGLFWIALRTLDELGLYGLWAIVAVTLSACIPAVWFAARQQQLAELGQPDAWLTAGPLGLSLVLYFVGVLTGDVIRVIFLFYLLPVWTLLAARIIYKQPITRQHIIFIGIALFGLWLLLTDGNQAVPWPQSLSDWCGIGSGMLWGTSLAVLRGRPSVGPFASSAAAMLIGLACATVLGLVVSMTGSDIRFAWPDVTEANRAQAIGLSLMFGAAVMFPAMLGQIWGARLVQAPTAALLTMTEIIVAVVSAYFLAGTELGPVSALGGLLIVGVVAFDVVRSIAKEHANEINHVK